MEAARMKFKKLLMKSLPYVLSVIGGIIVYIVFVVNVRDDANLNGLMSNVAASLLAIPLIFILYDYVTYKMSSNLDNQLAESMTFDVNAIVLKVLKALRRILAIKKPLSWPVIQSMLRMRAREIRAKMIIDGKDMELLKAHKKDLNELSYKLARARVLSDRQVQIIISMTKHLAHAVNEWEYKGNTSQLAKYMEDLMDGIGDWFDSIERESLQTHQQFQLTIEQEAAAAGKNKGQ